MSQLKPVEKVVSLKSAAEKKKPALPPILQSVRLTARKQLATLVEGLFDNTDDALFELADKSESDRQQEMYFDSMRHIRLHRNDIAKSFAENFMLSWQSLNDYPHEQVDVSKEDDGLSLEDDKEPSYSLLGQDALEMSVAVAGIVSKVTSLYSLPIMQVTKRLGAVVAPSVVSERLNPIGPHALSTSFSDALAVLDIPIKVHIIIMKLFERFVMERMGPVYELVNRQLKDAGILPELNKRLPRASSHPTSRPAAGSTPASASGGASGGSSSGADRSSESLLPSAGDGSHTTAAEDAGFATVQSLLAGLRATDLSIPWATHNHRHASGTELPIPELLATLTTAQQQVGNTELDIERVPPLTDIYNLVRSTTGNVTQNLDQTGDDTVNFIGLLFDYILNDRNLAIPMKALISRLQIPVLKLALMDKSFFSKSTHPARALLNDLSSAGIGWSSAKELKRDKLYDKIESVVHQVLNDFEDNPELFSELLADFRDFVSHDSRRTLLVEQRVKDTEQGKAHTQGAKLAVQKVINQKASGMRLPQELGRFISENWSRVLTLIYVKHGTQSPHWTAGVGTLDDLLWVMQPLSEEDEVDRRDKLADPLLTHIREGMTDLGCPEDEIIGFTNWLGEHLAVLSKNDRAYLEVDEREELQTPTAIVQDIILSNVVEISDEEIAPSIVKELKALTEGAWVELTESGHSPIRCKLATVTEPGHNYVFVNKRGMKVAEKNRLQLAGLLETDCLKLIDESQVFDRALQSVIGNLRDMQRQRPKN